MATQEIQIAGSNEVGKIRDPLITALLLFVPLYGIFWYFYVNKEMAEIGQARGTTEAGDNPTNSVLAVFPGVLACGIPTFISYFKACGRLQAAERITGSEEGMDPPLLFLLLLLLSPVGVYIFQQNMNKVLQAQLQGAGGQLPPQQPQQAPPAEAPQEQQPPPPPPPQQ
jgi:hypothetical protein